MTRALLAVRHLCVTLQTGTTSSKVVDGVCLEIAPFESIAVIGESGSGKSILGHAIMRLLDDIATVEGEVRFKGNDIYRMNEADVVRLRGTSLALIPQNPASALNPVLKIGRHLMEVARKNGALTRRDAKNMGIQTLRDVGFNDPHAIFNSYPHRLSGGMCGRVLIAMALIGDPDLVIADEPTKGLDFPAKRPIMDLLIRSAQKRAMLLITHDLNAAAMCARGVVMYGGRVVEIGPSETILNSPAHPYTRGLLDAQPSRGLKPIPGGLSWKTHPDTGCRFRDRCRKAGRMCEVDPPILSHHGGSLVRCHLA